MAEDAIVWRLDQILKLLASIVTKEDETEEAKILRLASIGLKFNEIANILRIEAERVAEVSIEDGLKNVGKKDK